MIESIWGFLRDHQFPIMFWDALMFLSVYLRQSPSQKLAGLAMSLLWLSLLLHHLSLLNTDSSFLGRSNILTLKSSLGNVK